MARPLRIDMAGGVYHVTARGWERRQVVRDEQDRWQWLRLLDRVAERYGWRVYAWALMRNHWHLFLSTPEATLSRGMCIWPGNVPLWRWGNSRSDLGQSIRRRYPEWFAERANVAHETAPGIGS